MTFTQYLMPLVQSVDIVDPKMAAEALKIAINCPFWANIHIIIENL